MSCPIGDYRVFYNKSQLSIKKLKRYSTCNPRKKR